MREFSYSLLSLCITKDHVLAYMYKLYSNVARGVVWVGQLEYECIHML